MQYRQIIYKEVFLCLRRQKSEVFWNFREKLSAREVSKVLGVSRNTVAEVQALFLQSGRSWDDISEWDGERLYELLYPDKFTYKPRYAPADYSYVHRE